MARYSLETRERIVKKYSKGASVAKLVKDEEIPYSTI